jgi:uncharacterized protein (DUF952 family)
VILHIAARSAWEEAVAADAPEGYRAASLATEGFIHLSTPEQVLLPADGLYRGQTDLVLLCVAPERLTAPLVYEDCYESGIEFPHLYGPLALDSVFAVVDFPCGPDGTFELPELPDPPSAGLDRPPEG